MNCARIQFLLSIDFGAHCNFSPLSKSRRFLTLIIYQHWMGKKYLPLITCLFFHQKSQNCKLLLKDKWWKVNFTVDCLCTIKILGDMIILYDVVKLIRSTITWFIRSVQLWSSVVLRKRYLFYWPTVPYPTDILWTSFSWGGYSTFQHQHIVAVNKQKGHRAKFPIYC